MGFFRSNQLQIGLFFLILIQILFLLYYRQEKVKQGVPNDKHSSISMPGDFVSILSFHYLFALNKGSLRQMTVNNTYKGTISRIYANPGVYIGFLYEKAIEIDEDNKKNTIPIVKSAMANLLVKDINGYVMAFEDLKVGDLVEVAEVLDLTQRHPLASQKIIIEKIN